MDKKDLLQELSQKVQAGEISREEITALFSESSDEVSETKAVTTRRSHFSITKMLYALGGAIVIIGIAVFIAQVWSDIGSFGRISVTLGLGFALAIIGSVLLKQRPGDYIGPVFHVLGGVLMPGGAVVALVEMGVEGSWPLAITFFALFLFYLLLTLFHKNVILTFFTIANATVSVYLLLEAIVGSPFRGWFGISDVYQYLTMAVGIVYLLLGHSFRKGWNSKLVRVLYILGSIGFLGAAFSQVFGSLIWQLIYLVVLIGALFLSVHFKSRGILAIATLFLIAHVSYITSEYFADSLGWPISLVILGFVFIGLGYTSIAINKKYIKTSE